MAEKKKKKKGVEVALASTKNVSCELAWAKERTDAAGQKQKDGTNFSILPIQGNRLASASNTMANDGSDNNRWSIDSRAMDHMTNNFLDFSGCLSPKKSCVTNANGIGLLLQVRVK